MLAEFNEYSYTNIAMSFWGEGYSNFGLLGIFVFKAILNAFIDSIIRYSDFLWRKVLFLFFLEFEFYLLRGDLYSSCKKLFEFTLAIILVLIAYKIIIFMFKFKRRKINRTSY